MFRIPTRWLAISSLLWVSLTALAEEQSRLDCDLWQDPQGITHVRGQTDLGTYACMGFLHGRDRGWQMDFFRRTVQGRRAEILGYKEIRSDFFMRLLNLYPRSEAIFKQLPIAQQDTLRAYAKGVNRGFAAALEKGVYEFQHWDYRPEPWKPSDTIATILLQSFDQTRQTFQTDLEEYRSVVTYGKDASEIFSRDGLPWDASILKPGEYPRSQTPKTASKESSPLADPKLWAAAQKLLKDLPETLSFSDVGSNSWVIAPAQSKTRRAWLANDPHLDLKHPAMWYWTHIQSPSLDVIGASLPGVPLIVSGTNRQVSFGLTNSYLDVADLTVIPTRELTGRNQPISERPLIWFKVWKFKLPFFFKTTERIFGHPILPLEGPKEKSIILSWTGFDLTAADFSGFFELNSVRSAEEADRALSRIGVPSWNFVFADTTGKIGYRAVGRVPRREVSRPYGMTAQGIADFANRLNTERMLSSEEMPHLMNPARGWLATANNRQWPTEARFRAGRGHRQGFRQFRIEELLTQNAKQDFESMSRTQCDVQAVEARFLLPSLLKNTASTPATRKALEILRSWDYQATLECEACGLFRRWMDLIKSESGLNPPGIYKVLQNSQHVIASRLNGTLQETLAQAIRDTRQKGNSDPNEPTFPKWGEVHGATFVHMGDRDFFQDRGVATPGDNDSVNPGTSEWENGFFRHKGGASQRLIVEMTNPPTVHAILPGRNEDSTLRDFDQNDSPWKKWAACEYEKRQFPLDWTQVEVKKLSI